MWLTLLISEYERHLAIKSVSLNQISIVSLSVNQLNYEHFKKNERCVDCREDPLDRILFAISIDISVIWVTPHSFEHYTI